MTAGAMQLRPKPEQPITVTVWLTRAELSAVSRADVVVTSPFAVPVARAAERGLRKLRDAAEKHPHLPEEPKGHR